MRTAYPSLTEFDLFLFASGLITPPTGSTTRPQDVLDTGAALFAAIAEWERGTGWVPFLTEAVATTRTFDPPGPERGPVGGIFVGVANMGGGRRLFLNAGVRTITTLKIGVTPTSTGTTLVQNTDYWLRPQNATAFGRPYTYVEFGSPVWGPPNSVTILAPFGFGATLVSSVWVPTVPDDAWLAIMKMAAVELVPQLEMVLTGGESSIKLGNDEFKFNPNLFQRQVEMWQMQNAKILGRYKRKVTA